MKSRHVALSATPGSVAARRVSCLAPRPYLFRESRTSGNRASVSCDIFRQHSSHSFQSFVVRSAAEKVESTLDDLQELTKLDYYQYIEDAGEDLVVVDFYTDWCGPCKLMYPKLQQMAEDMKSEGVRFVRFNCNKYNKELGSGLGVRVAPTFFFYKNGVKVAEMTGAHVDKLKNLIESNK